MILDEKKSDHVGFYGVSENQNHLLYRKWLWEVTVQLLQLYYS